MEDLLHVFGCEIEIRKNITLCRNKQKTTISNITTFGSVQRSISF